MILRKVVSENGKIVYEPIKLEEALKINKSELVFTDEEEEDRYNDFNDESDEEIKSNNKNIQKIIMGLPFLDDEDLKEIVDGIIQNPSEYSDFPLVTLFPFLDDGDADRLFLKCVDNNLIRNSDIASLVTFVSEECLEKFVDDYTNGKHQHVDVNTMYPFLSSESIKKLFKYYLNKKENEK